MRFLSQPRRRYGRGSPNAASTTSAASPIASNEPGHDRRLRSLHPVGLGGLPFADTAHSIELVATEILPVIRRETAAEQQREDDHIRSDGLLTVTTKGT
jgi:hypothetical protein